MHYSRTPVYNALRSGFSDGDGIVPVIVGRLVNYATEDVLTEMLLSSVAGYVRIRVFGFSASMAFGDIAPYLTRNLHELRTRAIIADQRDRFAYEYFIVAKAYHGPVTEWKKDDECEGSWLAARPKAVFLL